MNCVLIKVLSDSLEYMRVYRLPYSRVRVYLEKKKRKKKNNKIPVDSKIVNQHKYIRRKMK